MAIGRRRSRCRCSADFLGLFCGYLCRTGCQSPSGRRQWVLGSGLWDLSWPMSAIIMLTGRPVAWGLGLAAGTLLGLQVVESSGLSNQVLRYGLVAVVASMSASLLTFLQSTFQRLGLFLPRPGKRLDEPPAINTNDPQKGAVFANPRMADLIP